MNFNSNLCCPILNLVMLQLYQAHRLLNLVVLLSLLTQESHLFLGTHLLLMICLCTLRLQLDTKMSAYYSNLPWIQLRSAN